MDMSIRKFALGLTSCAAIACPLIFAGAIRVEAQNTGSTTLSDQTLKDSQQVGGSPYTVTGSNLNFLQLIHNATLNNGRAPSQEQQNDALNSAVEGYKTQRNQELKLSPSTFSPTGGK
jgi:hypothetical protein